MINILEDVAQEESVARCENIKWGILPKTKSGESKIFNRKCNGYIQDEDGNLTIQDSETEVVKRIFDLKPFNFKAFQLKEIPSIDNCFFQ